MMRYQRLTYLPGAGGDLGGVEEGEHQAEEEGRRGGDQEEEDEGHLK